MTSQPRFLGSLAAASARRSDMRQLETFSISQATALNIDLQPYFDVWRELRIFAYDIEKPTANTFSFAIFISTNGATYETVSLYERTALGWGATFSTVSVFSATAEGSLLLDAAGQLTTATTRRGGILSLTIPQPNSGNVDTWMQYEWAFMNSTSNPCELHGVGLFASGPCRGIRLGSMAAMNFDARAVLYGIGRLSL